MQRVLPVLTVVCFLFSNYLFSQNTPTIFCPADINEFLDPGECEEVVNFQVSASSNGNPNPPQIFQIDNTGLTSGDVFPMGTTTLQFVAADTASPQPWPADTCTFNINVIEYQTQTNAILTDDDLWISIPAECEMYLTPAMVLEGNYGCYDDFEVDVENTGSNYIGQNYVGQTISYIITNTETGMMGWGDVTIEDKSGPLIEGCDTVRVGCLADTRPASEGGDIPEPVFTDCFDHTEYYQDIPTPGTCQDTFSTTILRFWTAVDELGNVSSCNQIIIVDRTLLTDISPICPPDITIECVVGLTPDLSPANTGYPTAVIDGNTYEITEGPSICNITSQYSDMIVDGCGASYKVIRTWSIMDWCLPIELGVNPWTCTQMIEHKDTTSPVVSTPADVTVTANLPGCRAKPTIPAVTVSDCSGYSVFIFTPVGPIPSNGGQVPAPGLTLGVHTIEIRVTDECGRTTTVEYEITVEDQTQPNPVCDKHTVVSLDNTGYAFAYAESFDDGSSDNCCLDGFEVKRETDNCNNPANLLYGEYIEFCCEDVGQTLEATLKVWDCYGNSNICEIEIEVQDINDPLLTCPPDVTLDCGDDYNDPLLAGQVETDPAFQGPLDGLATDNCDPLTVTSLDVGQVDCGGGTIKRTYTATDPAGRSASCLQTITIINNNQFTGLNIMFPADITLTSCTAMTDPSVTGEPTYPPSTECFILMHGQEPDLVSSGNGACLKIERRWFVIDWCQYDANNPNSPGRWTHSQIIVVMDAEGPTFPTCDNLTFCNFKSDCSDLAPDLSVSATDACTDDNLLTYSWTVDLYDDGQPDPAGYALSGIGLNTTNNYPLGSHRIRYTAYDGCGNSGQCNFLFTIDDCKNPVVSCMNGMIIGIMATGMIPVNVGQMESGASSDNCTVRANLLFSFSINTSDTQRIFDCDDVGINPIEVWATDEAGNQDYCTTFVEIQDNMGACGSPLVVLAGAVEDEMGGGVEDVAVELNGNTSSTITTDSQGVFTFNNVPFGRTIL